ncbi:Uncharacterised protein [Klebsiella pneumoniae]|nr:Uncharacterised protein [Acinetobacter baumannii]SVL50730.1 Uncharacterised protein [Klebsiella pneumoniae]SYR78282.1 Uncharacterised protein [Klebsiella pneumoniae]
MLIVFNLLYKVLSVLNMSVVKLAFYNSLLLIAIADIKKLS